MSLITRVGTLPYVSPLDRFTFTYSAIPAEEPSVGDVVVLKPDGTVKKSDADFSLAGVGVVVSKRTSTRTCVVAMQGVVYVTAAAAVSAGAVVGTSTNGRVKAIPAAGGTYAASDTENAKARIGKALTSAAAADDKLYVMLSVV
ncbi:MAG: hypothetical protein QW069_08645 [Candidatus Caldarchaeum sp.]